MATENEYYIPLENVDSEHCAMIVDKGLAGIGTVSAHRVELNNNRAVISAPKIYQALPDVVKTIRGLGYGVTTVKKNWPVMNMTCASCANTVDSVLAYQPGVVAANVNFANATVQVEYIPRMTDAHKLRAAVQAVGYDIMIDEGEDAKDSLENAQQASSRALRRKTWGAVILSVPLVVIAMVPAWMNESWANYVMWVLATPVVFYFGSQFFVGAWKQLRHRSANMDTLVALSTGVAYVFSVFNTLFPHYWHERGLHAHVYFEASAVVIAFVLLGKLLEEKAKNNTSSAIKKLIGLQPKTVTMIHGNGHQMEMPIGSVQLGNILLVKPGEKIPVDGTVTTGTSYVDESTITGEPVPVAKKADDKVLAGTINQKGSFQMRADKVGSTTLLAQIIQTVQEAQGSKAPVQKLVDKIAGIFVPVVIIIAVLSAIVWWIFGGENGLAQGLVALVTVLVIACPCALGLATPTAIMVGMGNGAEKGILIKDAESLEKLQKINAIVLDKTGTITEGHPEVNDLKWLEQSNSEWVNILYSIEKSSEHPLAEAIVKYLGKEAQFIPSIAVENVTGQGITGIYNQVKYFVGNAVFLSQNNLPIEDSATQWAQTYLDKANTVVFFANTEKILAGIAIADRIKPSSAQAVAQLQKSGIEVFMLTGDNEQTAQAVARQTGIQHIQANVLPQDKSAFVRKLQSQGKTVAMVGDGINDSSALAQADVGIAMGHGSDIAMDVAQMTIVSSDLQKIPLGIELSKATSKTIRQNLFWAFIYNIIGIPLAAGVLYPVNGFLLNPMIAGAAMALSSVSVVANSLRGRWK